MIFLYMIHSVIFDSSFMILFLLSTDGEISFIDQELRQPEDNQKNEFMKMRFDSFSTSQYDSNLQSKLMNNVYVEDEDIHKESTTQIETSVESSIHDLDNTKNYSTCTNTNPVTENSSNNLLPSVESVCHSFQLAIMSDLDTIESTYSVSIYE